MQNDPYFDYTYNVLKNRLNVTDEYTLNEVECVLAGAKMMKFEQHKIAAITSTNRLKSIHNEFFSEIYDWAGKIRTINITGGNTEFFPCDKIDIALSYLNDQIKEIQEKQYTNIFECCLDLSKLLLDINEIHPFRKGNGRVQREFIRQLARERGVIINIQFLVANDKYSMACVQDDVETMAYALQESIERRT